MRRRTRRYLPATLENLESRRLLANGIGHFGEVIDFIRQDGSDNVGNRSHAGYDPDGFQDTHIRVSNVPLGKTISSVRILAPGDEWSSTGGNWQAYLTRNNAICDIYVQSPNTGVRNYTVILNYTDNTSSTNGADYIADESNNIQHLRTVTATWPALQATGLGYGASTEDLTGPSTEVGADGRLDYRIAINGVMESATWNPDPQQPYGNYIVLRNRANPTDPGAVFWSSQPTFTHFSKPPGYWDAQLIRGAEIGSSDQFVLFVQPPATTSPAALGDLYLEVHYTTSMVDTLGPFQLSGTSVAPAAGVVSGYTLTNHANLSATWQGQTTQAVAGAPAGSVQVTLNNLPAGKTITSMVLSNATGGATWVYGAPTANRTWMALPLIRSGNSIYFAPNRNEGTSSKLSLRIAFSDGTESYVTFNGGAVDLAAYDPAPPLPATPLVISPLDVPNPLDLQNVLNNNRYVKLKAGVYQLSSQLVLSHPVKVVAEPGAVLSFTSAGIDNRGNVWKAAIWTESSHVHLDGFSVVVSDLFSTGNNSYHPSALIYVDGSNGSMAVDVQLTNLTLTLPQLAPGNWYDTLVGVRTGPASSGLVDSVTFNGNATLISGGPWVFSNNDYTGTRDGTIVTGAFITRDNAHDISLINNKIHQDSATGITTRFLYMRQATNVVVSGNRIYGKIGPVPGESHNLNVPEVIMTDNIDPFYIGKPAFVSSDGYLLKVNQLRTDNGATPTPGHIVSIIDDSYAGGVRWFRIGQVIDKYTYLMLDPLPANLDKTISINYGYYNHTIERNSIDLSDSRLAPTTLPMSLSGSLFNVRIADNYFKSGNSMLLGSSVLQTYPASGGPWNTPQKYQYRAPDIWARTPSFGVTIEGNVFEDAAPVDVSMINDGRVPTDANSTRILFEGSIVRNTWVYTSAYLTGAGAPAEVKAIRVGNQRRVDTSDYTLVVDQNTVLLPSGFSTQAALVYNNGIAGSPARVILGAAPAAPTSVVANGNTGATRIDVSWGGVAGAVSYELQRSLDGAVGWTRITPLGSTGTSYQDSQVVASKAYYYRVRVKTAAGYSVFSSVVSAIAQTPSGPPAPATDLTALSLNQDGADFVGKSTNSGSNGFQDVHLVLSGLNTGLAITAVDVQAPGVHWTYAAPFGSNNTNGFWRAEVLRRGLSTVADLYLEAGPTLGSTAFTVTVTYAGGSTQNATFHGMDVANGSLPQPTLSAVSLNQDGGDLVGMGTASASDGYQDVHVVLNGLNSGSDVSSIYIQAPGFDSRYYASPGSDNPSGPWRSELLRQGRSTRGDLYFQAGGAITASQQFTVTVNYANGAVQTTTLTGVTVSNATMATPSFGVLALNQDGRDLVGKSSYTGPNGYQDVHLALSGLNTALAVASVTIQAPGVQWDYQAPFRSNNANGFWRAELLRQGLSSTADLYFEPGGAITSTQQFTVMVRYADNSTRTFTLGGVTVTNSQLPMAATLTATSLNQDGADVVGKSSNSGANGFQDVHVVLSGLKPGLAVTGVDVQAPGVKWIYSAPFGSNNSTGDWRAELLRRGASTIADLYLEPGGAISPSAVYTVTVTYAGGSTQTATLSGINVANASLPVSFPATSLSVASLNQDGADFVGKSPNSGSNGSQDVHLALSGLKSGLAITGVNVQTSGGQWIYSAPFGSNNSTGDWRAELLRQGLSSTGDLYFETGGAISPTTSFTVTVTYAGGSTQSATFSGISVANASLAMPTLKAVSLNQDGADYVGKSVAASPSSTQDVHLVLSGLYSGLEITGVDLQAPGFHSEYVAPFGVGNTNGNWRAEFLRRGLTSTGDLYFEPGGAISGSTAFTVTVTYAGGVTQTATFYGISVTNASLPTARLINYNQDNRDFAGSGAVAAPDGYQDVHFAITGIPIGVDVSKVVIFGDGSSDLWEYNGLSTSTSIAVDRNVNTSSADLYFQPNRKDRGLRKYNVTVVLSNGTVLRFVVDALVANPQLAKV